jgi:NADPH-dependent 2,4-dienoyl-CoA reductase/sulfur reductase-like enzyme
MVSWAESTMRKNGVDLVLGDGVASFEQSGSRLVVKTSSGKAIDTDMVIMSIGVRAESDLAKQAGLKLTQSGCIAVDENMRTSHPKVC